MSTRINREGVIIRVSGHQAEVDAALPAVETSLTNAGYTVEKTDVHDSTERGVVWRGLVAKKKA